MYPQTLLLLPLRLPDRCPQALSSPSSSGRSLTASLTTLANQLLLNAASWRVQRGQTYCVYCRGSGRATCAACHGAGIGQPQRIAEARGGGGGDKLKSLLGLAGGGSDEGKWIQSNRCSCCRGTGAVACEQCGGAGRRGPAATQ